MAVIQHLTCQVIAFLYNKLCLPSSISSLCNIAEGTNLLPAAGRKEKKVRQVCPDSEYSDEGEK